MKKRFNQIDLPEKDEHKKTKEYKKLSPAMRKAVDHIFGVMDAKPSDFLNSFETVSYTHLTLPTKRIV